MGKTSIKSQLTEHIYLSLISPKSSNKYSNLEKEKGIKSQGKSKQERRQQQHDFGH